MFCRERMCNVLSNSHKILMIYPSCCCFPKYSGNKEQGIKSSQDLAEWCNMFKYVNCVSGSPNDWRKPIKKKLNITLACHEARVLLSVLMCSEWSPVPVGRPWLLHSAPLSISHEGCTEAETMPADGSWASVIPGLAEWVIYVVKRQFIAGESPGGWSHLFMHGAVLHTAVQCLAPQEEAPSATCMGPSGPRHPGDFLTWTCAQRNWPQTTNASLVHPWFPGWAGRMPAGGPSGWVTHAAPSHGCASSCQSAL